MENKKLPLNINQCPNCGSKRRIADSIIQKQKDEGKANPECVAYITMYQSAIFDQTKNHLSYPVLTSFFDACLDCGTFYCVHAEENIGVPGMKPPKGGFAVN